MIKWLKHLGVAVIDIIVLMILNDTIGFEKTVLVGLAMIAGFCHLNYYDE